MRTLSCDHSPLIYIYQACELFTKSSKLCLYVPISIGLMCDPICLYISLVNNSIDPIMMPISQPC